MKKILLLLSVLNIALAFGKDVQEGISSEKNVTLCKGDTCLQATITPYDTKRDQCAVQKLLGEEQFKLSHTTSEFLVRYFDQKNEVLEQSSSVGLTISGKQIYRSYVLRDGKTVLGCIAFQVDAIKKPSPAITGSIVLLATDSNYRDAVEKQLLQYALQDMIHQKAVAVNIVVHEKNAAQRSVLEKMGFVDNTQQVNAMKERVKKSMSEKQRAEAESPENHPMCYYMKMLEENITEKMRNPKPIESSLHNITQENFEQEVSNADKPVVIDVYTDWCEPCRLLAPIIDEVAKEQAAYKFVRFNCVPEEQDLVKRLDIEVFPTLLFVKEGKIIGRQSGFVSKEILQQKLAEFFTS